MPKNIPDILNGHILPFDWDVRKVWAIDAEAKRVPCAEFMYLLELPLWSSVPGRGMLFDVRPIDVIHDPGVSAYQAQRLRQVDLRYPIDVLMFQGKRWLLDGVHRIAGHYSHNLATLPVRFHDESIIPAIELTDESRPTLPHAAMPPKIGCTYRNPEPAMSTTVGVKLDDETRWARYQESGRAISQERVMQWLDALAAGRGEPCPK